MSTAPHADSVFKFLQPEAAVKVLSSGCLRWSSPELFNDPLEAGPELAAPLEHATVLDETVKLATSLIFARDVPKGDSPLINAIRRWRDENRFNSASEAVPVVRDLLDKTVSHHISQVAQLFQQWQIHLATARICSFGKDAGNPLVWRAYGGHHTGLALRLDAQSPPFNDAQKVDYQSERPQLVKLRDLLALIIHNRPLATAASFEQMHLVKSNAFKAEQEWRCLRKEKTSTTEKFVDVEFPANSLTGVYLGLNFEKSDINEIQTLVSAKYPRARLFACTLNQGSYELEFKKIGE